MLDLLLVCLTLLLKVSSLWFFAVALFTLRRPKPYPNAAPRTRFACLIAARNEEAVIAALVESLRAQSYPAALYDIFVIPNNCTDATEAEALRAGAKIFRCFEPVRCKGDALHEAIGWLLPRGYDAFCVFDADNLVDADFLARMNDALCAGAEVCKGAMRVKNPYDSWLAGCYGLYFTLFDTFFSRARMSCGLSAKLVGTGFAVRREVLERLGGWRTETLAEDAEFSAQCAALGVRVHFVPAALTYDEAPTSFRLSLRQRRRWCSGIMDVAKRERRALLTALGGRAPWRAFDALLFLHAPFLQIIGIVPFALFLLDALAQGELQIFLQSAALVLVCGAATCTGFAALLALLGGYRDRRIVKSVLGFPLFMASWLPLQVVSLVHRTQSWQPIAHGCVLRRADILTET